MVIGNYEHVVNSNKVHYSLLIYSVVKLTLTQRVIWYCEHVVNSWKIALFFDISSIVWLKKDMAIANMKRTLAQFYAILSVVQFMPSKPI